MFNKLIFFIFLLFFSSVSLLNAQPDDILKKGNDYYLEQNYSRAIEMYESLVKQGYEGTELYYNLGNAYYRTGKLGFAILYYERALKLSPSDEDARHNLALANIQTVDKIETLPQFFLFQWWESILAFFSVSGWAILGYFLFLLLLGFVILYTFIRKPMAQKVAVYGALASIGLLVFIAIVIGVSLNRVNNVKHAIIVAQTATAKLAPDDTSNDAFVIHEGLKVNVEDNVSEWLKVRLEDGKIGWLQKNNLRLI